MCPQCEWSEDDVNDIDFDVFNNSGVQANINMDIDFDPVLDPPSSGGLSFAHLNVNGLDVEGRIDEMRLLFKHKAFDIIGINETKLTTAHITSSFNIDGNELLRAERKRGGKNQDVDVLFILKTM